MVFSGFTPARFCWRLVCWRGFLENLPANTKSTPAKPKNASKKLTLMNETENNPNEAPSRQGRAYFVPPWHSAAAAHVLCPAAAARPHKKTNTPYFVSLWPPIQSPRRAQQKLCPVYSRDPQMRRILLPLPSTPHAHTKKINTRAHIICILCPSDPTYA